MGKDKKTEHVTSISGKIDHVPYKKKMRIVVWGGFNESRDWWAFHDGRRTVVQDYGFTPIKWDNAPTVEIDKNGNKSTKTHESKTPPPPNQNPNYALIEKHIARADEIAALINSQPDDSVRSLDTFFHGNSQSISLSTAPPGTPIMADEPKMREWWAAKYRSSLYVGLGEKNKNIGLLRTLNDDNGSITINAITYSKFTENAKIEIHSCKAAQNFVPQEVSERRQRLLDEWPPGIGNWIYGDFTTRDDNIAAAISQKLYVAGKTQSVVIAHVTQSASKAVNGRQDYRHGTRLIYHNGRVIGTVKNPGEISEEYIEKLLNK